MAELWRQAPLADHYAETPGGAVTGIARQKSSADEPSFQEAWRSAPIVEPSFEAKAGAVAQGMTGGFLEGAPAVAGAVTGAKLGSLLGPWGMAGGTVLGAVTGALAGKTLRGHAAKVPLGDSTLTTPSVEDMRPELRPYAYGGEVLGAGAPIAAVPFAAAGKRVASPFVNRIIESAERTPATVVGAETAGLTASGIAGGVAESYSPGNTATRMGAEIAGGLFNPSRLLVGAARGTADATKAALAALSKSGTQNRAAGVLQELVTSFGEDPAALAKALRESGLPGVNATSAQQTASPALIALEDRLSKESFRFGAESKRMADDSLAAIRGMIGALEGTGSPHALKAAAEMRAQYFRTLLAGRLQLAERTAVADASKISTDTTLARTELSKNAKAALEEALSDSRAIERDLWGKVPRDIPAFSQNILAKYAELRADMLHEESLPAVIEGFVQRMKEGTGQIVGPRGQKIGAAASGETTTGELLLLRSRALMFAREAGAKGALNEARIYGNMAEAALDDLSAISASVPEIGAARQFSRELNDTFTRTFAGDALSAKPGGGGRATGAERVPPELLMHKAFGAGGAAGKLRFKQLEEAMSFLPKKGLGGPEAEKNLAFMLDAQERVLRLSAKESIDPTTGRVSQIRLSRFVEDHAELLERFPPVKMTLQNALKSEQGLKDVQRMAEGASKAIEKKAAFSRVVKFDSPADAVRNAIGGNTPTRDFAALAKLAKRGGQDATEGLKMSVWDDAIRRSSTETGELSFSRLQANLLHPVRPGGFSLVQLMRSQDVMTEAEAARARDLITRAINIETSLQRGQNLNLELSKADALSDLVVRLIGIKAGAAAAGIGGQSGGGHTLLAAGRGSSYARNVFEKVPAGRVRDVLIEAARDPNLAALLLAKPKTKTEGIRIARQLHSYILQMGITGDGQDADIIERGPDTSVIDRRLIPNSRPDRPQNPNFGAARG